MGVKLSTIDKVQCILFKSNTKYENVLENNIDFKYLQSQ